MWQDIIGLFAKNMALYLRDFIADDALLAYPYGANFDYHSILLACKDFHGKEEISVQEWIEIARNRFGFTLEQANAYSSVYFSLFCGTSRAQFL